MSDNILTYIKRYGESRSNARLVFNVAGGGFKTDLQLPLTLIKLMMR